MSPELELERLSALLEAVEGRFILSINDTPGARDIFARFGFDEVETTYTIATNHGGGKRAGELIVMGPNR